MKFIYTNTIDQYTNYLKLEKLKLKILKKIFPIIFLIIFLIDFPDKQCYIVII